MHLFLYHFIEECKRAIISLIIFGACWNLWFMNLCRSHSISKRKKKIRWVCKMRNVKAKEEKKNQNSRERYITVWWIERMGIYSCPLLCLQIEHFSAHVIIIKTIFHLAIRAGNNIKLLCSSKMSKIARVTQITSLKLKSSFKKLLLLRKFLDNQTRFDIDGSEMHVTK